MTDYGYARGTTTTTKRTTTDNNNNQYSGNNNLQGTNNGCCSGCRDENLWKNLWITFYECIGNKPTPAILHAMCTWVDKVGYDVVRYALNEAAAAPRPSWRYAQAVLKSCEGIKVRRYDPNEPIFDAIRRAKQVKEMIDRVEEKHRLQGDFSSLDITNV